MKIVESNKKDKTEISIKQLKQIEREFVDKIIPYNGHTVYEINNNTLEITEAKFIVKDYEFLGENKKEIFVKKGFTYISALNKFNALKKYHKKHGIKIINK